MAPTDPNEIDINLSLLPGDSELAINALVAQMRAISAQLAVIQAPDSGAAAQAQLLAFQQTGVPSNRLSATASVPDLGNVHATRRAIDTQKIADRAEEERRQQLEDRRERERQKRDDAERRRSDQQAANDAQRLLQEDQNRRRQEYFKEEYGTARAEKQLETAGPVRSLRYAISGRLDRNRNADRINRGVDPELHVDPQEALESTQPVSLRDKGVRGLVNRVLQVNTPESARLSDEQLRARAEQRAAQRLADEEAAAGRSVVGGGPPPRSPRGGPSVPPGVAVGDDGYPDPNHPMRAASNADVSPDAPAWQRHISEQFAAAPMTMPRIGEFTAQDSLTMMAQFLGRRAYDRDGGTGSTALGNSAAGFARMAATAPYLANLRQNMARRGFDTSRESLQRVAYLTGQDRPTAMTVDVPGVGGVAVTNPFAAARASVRGAATLGHIAEQGTRGSFLRTGEAYSLGGELINRGFSEDAAVNALRGPLGRIRGDTYRQLDPSTIVDAWQKSILAGGESMQEFTRSMTDLVPAARAARMNVDEFNASADQFAEQIQGMGGTYVGGRNAANEFSLQTGIAPQVGAQMMTNPLVQGLTYGQTGILPSLQGMLGQGTRTGMASQSLGMLVDMYKGGFSDQKIAVPGGHMTISARDQAIAMAGQQFGLDREAATRLYNQQGALKTMTPVNNAYDAYMQDVETARNRTGGKGPAWQQAIRRINQGQGASGVSRSDIAKAMDTAGLDGASIMDSQGLGIGDKISAGQRKRWGNIFDKQNGSGAAPNVTVALELRGEAKKLLKQVQSNQPAAQSQRARDSANQNASDLFKALGGTINDLRDWGG